MCSKVMKALIMRVVAPALALFGVTASGATQNGPVLGPIVSMVMLMEPTLPSPRKITEYLQQHWRLMGDFKDFDSSESMISFANERDDLFVVTLMDAPIPSEELEYPCQTAADWPQAWQQVGHMKAHLLVTVMSHTSSIAQQTYLLSALTQAAAATSPSIGIYLGGASSVWNPDQFASEVLPSTSAEPPYRPWIGAKLQVESNGKVSAHTMGMPDFYFNNIEIQDSSAEPEMMLEALETVAIRVLKNGVEIRHDSSVELIGFPEVNLSLGSSLLDAAHPVLVLKP